MSEPALLDTARAFGEAHGTKSFTISFEPDGMVWRDDQGHVIPPDVIPDGLEQMVVAAGQESVREMAADIRAAQVANPEDWDE